MIMVMSCFKEITFFLITAMLIMVVMMYLLYSVLIHCIDAWFSVEFKVSYIYIAFIASYDIIT